MTLRRPTRALACGLAVASMLGGCDSATDPRQATPRQLLLSIPDTVGSGDTVAVGTYAVDLRTGDTVAIGSAAVTSSDATVLRVTPLGRLVALQEGEVTITGALPTDGSGIPSDSERVVVRRLSRALVTQVGRDSLLLRDTVTVLAELRDGLGATMSTDATWRSSDTTIARVHPTTGLVRIVGDGDVDITASSGALESTRRLRAYLPLLATNGVRLTTLRLGNLFGCGLDAGGAAYCWGTSWTSVLGRPRPASGIDGQVKAVETSSRYTSIATGLSIACGTLADGSIECWGGGARWGATAEQWRPSRVPVPAGSGALVSAHPSDNQGHCVLAASGTDYCWGNNTYYVIGADSQQVADPRPIPFAPGPFATIDPGDTHGCAIDPSRALFCWGDLAQAGVGGNANRAEAMRVPGAPASTQVAVTWTGTCVLATDGIPWCGGRGSTVSTFTPLAPVAGAPRFTRLDAHFSTVCGLTATGELWCWNVGQGPLVPFVAHLAPTLMSHRLRFVDFGVGRSEVCGLTAEGKVACATGNHALGGA